MGQFSGGGNPHSGVSNQFFDHLLPTSLARTNSPPNASNPFRTLSATLHCTPDLPRCEIIRPFISKLGRRNHVVQRVHFSWLSEESP